MNSGAKIVLLAAAIVGTYWVGVEVGKTAKQTETTELLNRTIKNNDALLDQCARLSAQNKALKKFYNVVECFKMEEA